MRVRRHISASGGMEKRGMVSEVGFDSGTSFGRGGGGSQGLPETVSFVNFIWSISAGSHWSLFWETLSSSSA